MSEFKKTLAKKCRNFWSPICRNFRCPCVRQFVSNTVLSISISNICDCRIKYVCLYCQAFSLFDHTKYRSVFHLHWMIIVIYTYHSGSDNLPWRSRCCSRLFSWFTWLHCLYTGSTCVCVFVTKYKTYQYIMIRAPFRASQTTRSSELTQCSRAGAPITSPNLKSKTWIIKMGQG